MVLPFLEGLALGHPAGRGLDLADVQELVGHTSARTTERYAVVTRHKIMSAVRALDRAYSKARSNVEKQRVN